MDEQEKAKLLGSAGKIIKATHDHQPDFKKLSQPLPKGASSWFFCKGCGTSYGLGPLDSQMLARGCGKRMTNFDGLFFHSLRCPFCDSEENGPEIREILTNTKI